MFSYLCLFMCFRGGSLPASGWTGSAGGVGGEQTGADLPGWRQLASAVPLGSQQQQHHRLDTAVQVSLLRLVGYVWFVVIDLWFLHCAFLPVYLHHPFFILYISPIMSATWKETTAAGELCLVMECVQRRSKHLDRWSKVRLIIILAS